MPSLGYLVTYTNKTTIINAIFVNPNFSEPYFMFEQFELDSELLASVKKAGFSKPTSIQELNFKVYRLKSS